MQTVKRQRLRDRIIATANELFEEKKLRFTMDEIAQRLSISKKTIYSVFASRNELIVSMAERAFGQTGAPRDASRYLENDIIDRIEAAITEIPSRLSGMDIPALRQLYDQAPSLGEYYSARLAEVWEPVINLTGQAIERGRIRPLSLAVMRDVVITTSLRLITVGSSDPELSCHDALTELSSIIAGCLTAPANDRDNEETEDNAE